LAELSVVVVNWNGQHLLADCLSSLRRQSLKNLEVILVDNGSTDDSVAHVRHEYPEVRVLCLDRNYGFATANNRGIEFSSGEFIALLNNDTVAAADWAARLLDAGKQSGAGIVASKVLLHADPKLLDSAGDGMTTVGVAYKRGHREPSDRFAVMERVFGASGCAMLLRRSMLADIGLLDDDFFLLYEDADLCFRAQLRGWKCIYAPEAVVYHKLNSSIGRLSRTHVYYGQRNAEYLYFKNMPGRLLWKYLLPHFLSDLLALLYFSAKGSFWSFIKGKAEFLGRFREVMRKRERIQARRTVNCADVDRILERRWLRARLAGK